MKRQLFAVLVCMTMFAVTSCGEKKGKDKFEERIEKAKESVRRWVCTLLWAAFPIGKGLRWTTPKIIVSQPRSLRPAELR